MDTRKTEQVFALEATAPDGVPPAPGSPPAGTYDQRLNHLLQVSTALIARDGYHKTSMRAVARATGVSLAGLYHYFQSKEDLLFRIQFRTFSSLLNNLRERLHGVTEPVEQLRTMVRAHVGYFAANMAALKVCSHELDWLTGAGYDETRQIRRDYYRVVRAIVDRLLEDRAPGEAINPHRATMSLFGTLNWLYRWYDPRKDGSPTALANQIAEQFLHGLLGAR